MQCEAPGSEMVGASRFVQGVRTGADTTSSRLKRVLGGSARTQIVLVLAGVLGLSSADAATVGASAIELRQYLNVDNTDIGLLVAASSVVGAIAAVPFGVLADRVHRTKTLSIAVLLWGEAMLWSAAAESFDKLLLARLALGVATAAPDQSWPPSWGTTFPAASGARSTVSF